MVPLFDWVISSGASGPFSNQHSKKSGFALTERMGLVDAPPRASPWSGFSFVGGWRWASEGIQSWGCYGQTGVVSELGLTFLGYDCCWYLTVVTVS